jgi:hypothetical protein
MEQLTNEVLRRFKGWQIQFLVPGYRAEVSSLTLEGNNLKLVTEWTIQLVGDRWVRNSKNLFYFTLSNTAGLCAAENKLGCGIDTGRGTLAYLIAPDHRLWLDPDKIPCLMAMSVARL